MNKKTWDLYAPICKRAMKADQRIYDFMYERIPEMVRDEEVLEIAAGPGLLAKHIAPASKRTVATDYSGGMIAEAQKGECPANLSFEVADAMSLPYEDDFFNAVLIANTLHIVPDPERALREIGRVLRPGGLLIAGMIGCLLYVAGDFLFAATGRGQTTESIGFMVRIAYLEIGTWRMAASILCGFFGTILYYMGFHRMYGLLKIHVTDEKNRIWVKLFRVAYITGTVAWAYVHAVFMTVALIFKYVFQQYGDMQAAADIANRVFYANAAPMGIAYILCDVLLTVVMIVMVWKRIIPLKSSGAKVLATRCNPMMLSGIVGNLLTLLPWPLNQLDHGTESAGHGLVLLLGLILLRAMTKAGEPDRTGSVKEQFS